MKAIKAEQYGHSFYMMAANSTDDPKGKKIFEELAQEELHHMHFLNKQYDSVLSTGKLDESAKLGQRVDLSGMSPIFSESLKERIKNANFEMTSLSIGIQLEYDAMSYYSSQADAADDPKVKKLYAELTEWEAGHYHALLNQQDELKEEYWSASGFSPF
ncbi:MAG: ferritin family protein [candidate division Zixibacteria bacterium]|nr:ferritin family protein [candidate division Zixibacteria bacterium]